MSSSDSPFLLIVSSPSGAGKTTLTNALRKRFEGIRFSVSHTTRKARSNEEHGREYYFTSRADFIELIKRGTFLEWAQVHGNFYGTSQEELKRASGERCLLFDVDYQGARQIKARCPDAVGVFILPPSMTSLEQRLRGRASEDEATVQHRFKNARDEIEHYGLFDYVVENDDLAVATDQMAAILIAEECRRGRNAHKVERLIVEVRGYGGTEPPPGGEP
jgi:guanylate kinase